MSALMTIEYTMYDLNLVRSAIAPETIVADVAQNIVLNTMCAHIGTLPIMLFMELFIQNGSIPPNQSFFVPYMIPYPISQYAGVPQAKSIMFFMTMLPAFLTRVMPVSTIAKPACMKYTSAAPSSSHIVSSSRFGKFSIDCPLFRHVKIKKEAPLS